MCASTLEELEETVGFTIEFYQATSQFMGKKILEVVDESKCNRKVCPNLNYPFIAMIPKTMKSEDTQGFYPISLCNVIYKIIAMLIVKCLKLLLSILI